MDWLITAIVALATLAIGAPADVFNSFSVLKSAEKIFFVIFSFLRFKKYFTKKIKIEKSETASFTTPM